MNNTNGNQNQKLRVFHIPQIGMKGKPFTFPVSSIEEAKKMILLIDVYDIYQYENHIKPDFCNMTDLEVWNEAENEWETWYDEDGNTIGEAMEEQSNEDLYPTEMKNFITELYKNIKFI